MYLLLQKINWIQHDYHGFYTHCDNDNVLATVMYIVQCDMYVLSD